MFTQHEIKSLYWFIKQQMSNEYFVSISLAIRAQVVYGSQIFHPSPNPAVLVSLRHQIGFDCIRRFGQTGCFDVFAVVDVCSHILAGQHYGSIVVEAAVEALLVCRATLISGEQRAILMEDCQVEIVVVVSNDDFARQHYRHSDWVIRQARPSDGTRQNATVVEDLADTQK